jgi:DNA-directed RNA polymerase subunit RPC12/RpoP
VPSFSTTYVCAACGKSFPVEVTGLGDPHAHIPERSQEVLREVREVQNRLGQAKDGDPVHELAGELLEQEARSELRYATCPGCDQKNPEGVAANRANHRQSLMFGLVFFGVLAILSWFVPWAALVLPLMDLLVFRPIMVAQLRKSGQSLSILPFVAGIVLDAALIALIVYYPRAAPLVPIAGIVRSLIRKPAMAEWRWQEAGQKIRFEAREGSSA